MKNYELKSWNKTYSDRQKVVVDAPVVTCQNLEEELKRDAIRAAKHAESVAKRQKAIQQREADRVAAKQSRDDAARALIQNLRQNGQFGTHPTY